MRRSRAAALPGLLAALLVLAGASCGVPEDDGARAIKDESVPFGLLDPQAPESSTTVPAPTAAVRLYFVRDDRLVEVDRRVTASAGVGEALAAVAEGPTGAEAEAGVRSALPEDAVAGVERVGDVADIDLAATVADLETGEQLLAIAQLVYTATADEGVRAVTFRLEGRPVEVPTDGATLVRRPVSRADYTTVAPAG